MPCLEKISKERDSFKPSHWMPLLGLYFASVDDLNGKPSFIDAKYGKFQFVLGWVWHLASIDLSLTYTIVTLKNFEKYKEFFNYLGFSLRNFL